MAPSPDCGRSDPGAPGSRAAGAPVCSPSS
ncbi:hypothetical protein JOF36_003227 [Pseudonocardia parietis]|uniref:Uncharacterized protein n=1 Tax=Pseudonocardia parietis TaxID=570936 RepID=A0ABS4VUD5_9PSEU|nr:hypothetical protein [Pseudonocardia parietis]